MNRQWNQIVITEIYAAVYVAPNTGKDVHKDRPYHGFVLNDGKAVRDYHFQNGQIMRTEAKSLFYLPKDSTYRVETIESGGCYAINFDAEIYDNPFSISLRNTEALFQSFKAACDAWKSGDSSRRIIAMRAVCDAICQVQKDAHRQYTPGNHVALIRPAVELMNHSFTENTISISHLAELCGISEVYFRRLFLNIYGTSPKEYIIRKRIQYAKSLLESENFSVSEVAKLCGYTEPCHFSREFLRRVGIPPSRYFRK